LAERRLYGADLAAPEEALIHIWQEPCDLAARVT
jgi:hypothetical protein